MVGAFALTITKFLVRSANDWFFTVQTEFLSHLLKFNYPNYRRLYTVIDGYIRL